MRIRWATNVEKVREMINVYKVVRKFLEHTTLRISRLRLGH
jgi:hypothetical protein